MHELCDHNYKVCNIPYSGVHNTSEKTHLLGFMLAFVSCVEGALSNLTPSRWLTVLVNRMWPRHGWFWSCCTVALTLSVPDLGLCRSKCHHDIQLVVDYQMCRCVKCSYLISTKIFCIISSNTNVFINALLQSSSGISLLKQECNNALESQV